MADDREHDIGRDHSQEEPTWSDGAKSGSVGVRHYGGFRSRDRRRIEHDQRERASGDSIEDMEDLERGAPLHERLPGSTRQLAMSCEMRRFIPLEPVGGTKAVQGCWVIQEVSLASRNY